MVGYKRRMVGSGYRRTMVGGRKRKMVGGSRKRRMVGSGKVSDTLSKVGYTAKGLSKLFNTGSNVTNNIRDIAQVWGAGMRRKKRVVGRKKIARAVGRLSSKSKNRLKRYSSKITTGGYLPFPAMLPFKVAAALKRAAIRELAKRKGNLSAKEKQVLAKHLPSIKGGQLTGGFLPILPLISKFAPIALGGLFNKIIGKIF